MKVVVLSSGGLDSSLTMLLLRKEGHDVYPIHVNYGHLAEEREWLSCQRICDYLGLKPVRVGITGTEIIPSGLVHSSLDIEKDAFFPNRNLIFAVLGASYAYSVDCKVVALGILANPIFPDQTVDFFKRAEDSISAALGTQLKIMTPLISLDKREVLKLAKKHSLPFELTYFCHSGKDPPCGICISCKERIAAEDMLKLEN
ncbi:MAG: 7-cyano-7-deazaguanine synthase [Nitrososphaerota archaeon]|nr:7-cyano-7-deazaguanine synthase [Nitrososphaerota archaeon]